VKLVYKILLCLVLALLSGCTSVEKSRIPPSINEDQKLALDTLKVDLSKRNEKCLVGEPKAQDCLDSIGPVIVSVQDILQSYESSANDALLKKTKELLIMTDPKAYKKVISYKEARCYRAGLFVDCLGHTSNYDLLLSILFNSHSSLLEKINLELEGEDHD